MIAFAKLFDLGITQQDCEQFIISSPFLGITPKQKILPDPLSGSPIFQFINNLVNQIGSDNQDLVLNAKNTDQFYRTSPENSSIFKFVLSRVALLLEAVRTLWSGSAPENGIMHIEISNEFYRLWSCFLFIMCNVPGPSSPQGVNGALTDKELFGDAIHYAGATIIHVLGQKFKFETFDFSYHIYNVETASKKKSENPNHVYFLNQVSIARLLYLQIFCSLQTNIPKNDEPIIEIPAPKSEQEEKVEKTSSRTVRSPTIVMGGPPSISSSIHNDVPPPPPDDDDIPPPPSRD